MTTFISKNKRIAKNTLILYFRLLIIMGVSLYTCRIILNTLGVEDLGIYNIVGGLVVMFSMISGSFRSSFSRFITYELETNNKEKLKTIFSTSIIVQIVLSLIIVLLVESIGLWFLNNKLVIPVERMHAAHWVMQISLFTFVVSLISMPFNACIIAHERMSIFAYISIVDIISRLSIVYIITYVQTDKLILYACLQACVSSSVTLIYIIYCKRHFDECKNTRLIFKKEHFKKIFNFASWNSIDVVSLILREQGTSILLNFSGGPVLNAARAISAQVNNAISQFASGFIVALNPQITKSYASGDHEYMMKLIFLGARLSFYLLFILSLPVLINTQYVLTLWIGLVPAHTASFVRLVLILSMVDSLSYTLITAVLSTGNIRNYGIVLGLISLTTVPIAYIFMQFGFIPETVLIVTIIITICCLGARLYMLKRMMKFDSLKFIKKVIFNILCVSFLASIIPIQLSTYLNINFASFIITSICAVICTLLAIYSIGLSKEERLYVKMKIKQSCKNISNNYYSHKKD